MEGGAASMTATDKEVLVNRIDKMYKIYLFIVNFTLLVELVLAIRGFLLFDLSRNKHVVYLTLYLFLFAASLVTDILLWIYERNREKKNIAICGAHVYATALIIWATAVSTLDCIADGDSRMMVYITVIISVGALILIKPIYYSVMVVAGGVAFTVLTRMFTGKFYSSGFYINLIIFLAVAIFVNVHNYRVSIREYTANKKLTELSVKDQLTGIYNRRQLDAHMKKLADAKASFTFALIDADNFKTINDTFGHTAGDSCLASVADKLVVKFGNNVYRFGGDEFAVISPYDNEITGAKIALINEEFTKEDRELPLHISAGIYRTCDGDSMDDVFLRADQALYDSKKKGKAMWSIYGE